MKIIQGKDGIIEEHALYISACASLYVGARVCVHVCLREQRVLQWAVGYSLCCVCLLLQSPRYHNTEPRQLLR